MLEDELLGTKTEPLSRRALLTSAAVAGLAAASGASAQEGPRFRTEPVDTLKTIEQRPSLLQMDGISDFTVREHWKLYEGYVSKSNEILGLLKNADRSKANATYSEFRELKLELSFALDGMKNHEIYFGHLGGDGGEPTGRLMELINRDFGSFATWRADLKATGIAARGWAWLCFDYDLGRLMNYLGDSQNTFPVWNAVPILALDVYEHAFFHDFGTRKADYIEAFLKNLDWQAVVRRAEAARLL